MRKPFVSGHAIGDVGTTGVFVQFVHVYWREACLFKAKSESATTGEKVDNT